MLLSPPITPGSGVKISDGSENVTAKTANVGSNPIGSDITGALQHAADTSYAVPVEAPRDTVPSRFTASDMPQVVRDGRLVPTVKNRMAWGGPFGRKKR